MPDRIALEERIARLKAEEALRETQARLHTIIDAAPIVLWSMDPDGIVTLSEGKGLESLGLKPGQLVGRSLFELYGHLPGAADRFRRALAGEELTSSNSTQGQTFETRYVPRRDEGGRVQEVVGVSLNVTERLRMEEALRGLSRRLWSAQEEERRRVAAELEAEAGRVMATLERVLQDAAHEVDAGRLDALLSEGAKLATDVLNGLRRQAAELRPAALDELGLLPALRAAIDAFVRRTGIRAELAADEPEDTTSRPAHAECEEAAFRFVQEALRNTARHARASRVRIALERPDGWLRATVEDDGIGFDVEEALRSTHVGLAEIRERARMLGGRAHFRSRAGGGTSLSVELPNEPPAVGDSR